MLWHEAMKYQKISTKLLLQMFCIADPPYDKSLQQLQSFLSGLVAEEKLELREGVYILRKWSIPSMWSWWHTSYRHFSHTDEMQYWVKKEITTFGYREISFSLLVSGAGYL